MAPKVLFDLFSPRDPREPVDLRTYRPNETPSSAAEEVVPPPPKATSGVHIPKK